MELTIREPLGQLSIVGDIRRIGYLGKKILKCLQNFTSAPRFKLELRGWFGCADVGLTPLKSMIRVLARLENVIQT